MKKTEIIDVYQLYLGQRDILNGKNILRNKKIGIAYIPTKECSIFCRTLFENNNENKNDDYVLVKCKYLQDKEKWVPYKKTDDVKYPDLVDKIYVKG